MSKTCESQGNRDTNNIKIPATIVAPTSSIPVTVVADSPGRGGQGGDTFGGGVVGV